LERELEGLKAELANFQGDEEARAELEATIDMKNDKKVWALVYAAEQISSWFSFCSFNFVMDELQSRSGINMIS